MSVRTRTLLAWIAVGLAGLALAAGITYAATQLSSQRIGLSAEPPSAGEQLAPRRTTPAGERGQRRHERRAQREGHRRGARNPDD
jgi:hypothetical protein